MSLKWIGDQLGMGSWTYVSDLLVAKRERSGRDSRGRWVLRLVRRNI